MRVGEFLRAIGQSPEIVLTSTAVRARTTAELAVRAQESAGIERIPIVATDRLYDASVSDVADLLRRQDDDLQSVLIAGHEPTSSEAVSELTGGSLIKFPTAALARLDLLASSWSAVAPRSCRLAWLVTPKLLKAFDRG